ncbi:MAG: hypothetical protein ACKOOD_01200 [Microbacteriaceae bacterium]
MLSKTLAKKTLAVSASLALALGGAVSFTGSASAVSSAVSLSFGAADTLGNSADVAAFEGGTGTIADAPAATNGIGGDGKAFKFTKTGQPWSGANIILPSVVDTVISSKITLDYYNGGTAAEPVMLKVQEGTWPTEGGSSKKALEAAPGWNRLTFDMSTGTGYSASHVYKVMAIFPNFSADDAGYTGASAGAAGSDYYIDNIRFNGGVSVGSPFKRALTVSVDNALGQRIEVKIAGVRTWKSSGVGGVGAKTYSWHLPAGVYKVTVTVGSQTLVKTQVVK